MVDNWMIDDKPKNNWKTIHFILYYSISVFLFSCFSSLSLLSFSSMDHKSKKWTELKIELTFPFSDGGL